MNVYYRKKLEKAAEYYLIIKKDANACKNST